MRKVVWIVAGAVLAVFVVMLERSSRRNVASAADGVSAPAEILRADDGSCVGAGKHHCFALSLRVHPAGASPFERTIDVNVPSRWSSRVQPGQWVSVVLLRDKPGDVGLDLDAFAAPAPLPPTSAAAH